MDSERETAKYDIYFFETSLNPPRPLPQTETIIIIIIKKTNNNAT